MGGSGVIAYILAAIIMPERPVNVPPVKNVYETTYSTESSNDDNNQQ